MKLDAALGHEAPAAFAAPLNRQWLAPLRSPGSAPQAIASTAPMRNNHGPALIPAGWNHGVTSGLAGLNPDEAYGANEMQLVAGLAPPAATIQLAA